MYNQTKKQEHSKKPSMDANLYSSSKLKQKKVRIGVKVQNLKEKINELFDKEEADLYIRKKTVTALKKDYSRQ